MSTTPSTGEPLGLVMIRRAAFLALRGIFRLRVSGLEHLPVSGPVLLAGNHTGFLDGPIVFVTLPRGSAFLVKSELYVGVLRRALDLLRQIPVRRGTPDREALRRGLSVLAAGGVLGVFPEGTRGTGAVEAIQHGVGYLALRAGCPVVPVVCLGTSEALPKGHRVPRWRSRVDIVYGAPFHVEIEGEARSRRAIAEAAEQVRTRLRDHLVRSAAATGHPLPAPPEAVVADAAPAGPPDRGVA